MNHHLETLSLHAGYSPDASGSRAVPIHQTTSYLFRNTEHAADLFDLKEAGHIYTRLSNPTTDVLEQRIAALEGGCGALATASGQAAITLAVTGITSAGQNIVATQSLYGGTTNLFQHTLRRLGITTHFVDAEDEDRIRETINTDTRLLYTESIGNPKLDVVRIDRLAAIAHEYQIPLIVDATSVTPFLQRPIELGADIVVHSATKFIGGHGTSIGGLIVDNGRFNWSEGNYPELTEPDDSYHGARFTESFGNLAYIVRLRACQLRDLGPALSPFNAFLLLQGVETLGLRMERHSGNALTVARFLESHPGVAWVTYPGLASHPHHDRIHRYLPHGQGALVSFGVKGGLEAGRRFIENVKLLSHLANIGDARSLVIHPASTTHRQLTPETQLAAGVLPESIRLSVGLEHADDIIKDIDQALSAAGGKG